MSDKQVITVEKRTKFGVRGTDGLNYSISKFLKDVTPDSFEEGAQYEFDVYTGPKGGKSINKFLKLDGVKTSVPPIPALPKTTLTETKAPMGETPVKPAVKKTEDEKMTKADWADRNRTIELQALLKSTLESPSVAQLVVGKRLQESLEILKEVFEFSLRLYDSKK